MANKRKREIRKINNLYNKTLKNFTRVEKDKVAFNDYCLMMTTTLTPCQVLIETPVKYFITRHPQVSSSTQTQFLDKLYEIITSFMDTDYPKVIVNKSSMVWSEFS